MTSESYFLPSSSTHLYSLFKCLVDIEAQRVVQTRTK